MGVEDAAWCAAGRLVVPQDGLLRSWVVRTGREGTPGSPHPCTGFFFPLGGICRGNWQKRKTEVERLKGPRWMTLGPAGLGLGDVG